MLRTASHVLGWVTLVGMLGGLPSSRPSVACLLKPAATSEKPAQPKRKPTGAKSADKKTRSASKAKSSKKRLPKYFAQLKLDDQQRQQVLEIQAQYADQLTAKQELLDETRKQLDKLQKDQEREYQKVLKTQQKRRLKELRNRSKRSAAKKSKRG